MADEMLPESNLTPSLQKVVAMPYSESLAARTRQVLRDYSGIVEKKMFGGLAFLLDGNMCVGVWKTSLIARVGPSEYKNALQKEFVCEFDVTGRPMTGWVLVEAEGVDEDRQLAEWVQFAVDFVETLPKK